MSDYTKPSGLSGEKLLAHAKKCFKQALEAWQKQRQREKDDLRFQVPELQWDDQSKRERIGMAVDGVPTPARPILSITQIDQPIQLVLNQERAAHLGVNIHPLSPDAEQETAEVIQGIYRRIERDSQAHQARSWAFTRAVECGWGCYRINTAYDEEGGHPFDQVITIERILHQDSVYFDPSAQKPDFSDANWAFVTSWVTEEDFKRLYPHADVNATEQGEFDDPLVGEPEWVKSDGERKAYLVAEYFWKEYEQGRLALLSNGSCCLDSEVPEGVEPVAYRDKELVTVKWCKMTGGEILTEPQDWNGHYIPLIVVVGRELQPFDKERRWTGLIAPAKDGQKFYNYAASSLVERMALEPKAPYIMATGQQESFEAMWQQANTRNFPYLLYTPKSVDGQPVPPPQRNQVENTGMSISMMALQEAKDFVQSATATFDPSLGRTNPRERSGRAILALQSQSDSGNSHYLHNLADISMNYEARVVLDLIPAIYDRPGRLARTLDEEGESETVMLNAPHYMDPNTQRPMAIAEGQPQPSGASPKLFDLRKGIYGVSVSIGKSYQSMLQQGADEIGEILQAQPNLMPLIGPIYFKYRDFPGAREIADLLKKVREKQIPGLENDGTGAPTPEQAQAQIAAMQQQMQMLQQQLAQALQALETDKAKAEAILAKAQMDNQTKQVIARIEAQTEIHMQVLKQKFEALEAMLERQHDSNKITFEAGHAAAHEVATEAARAELEPMDLAFRAKGEPLGREDEL